MIGTELTAHLVYEAGVVPPAEESSGRNRVTTKPVRCMDGEPSGGAT